MKTLPLLLGLAAVPAHAYETKIHMGEMTALAELDQVMTIETSQRAVREHGLACANIRYQNRIGGDPVEVVGPPPKEWMFAWDQEAIACEAEGSTGFVCDLVVTSSKMRSGVLDTNTYTLHAMCATNEREEKFLAPGKIPPPPDEPDLSWWTSGRGYR